LPRLLSTVLVLGLLGGTAAAFAVTERLKLVPSPIIAPRVTEAFSPTCRCPSDHAVFSFGLRESDRITVTVVDSDGRAVSTLADGEAHETGRVSFDWDGRGAEEGVYRVRVHLEGERRTIEIPNAARLDTTPPQLRVESIVPIAFSPDGDGRRDFVRVRFSLSEPASIVLLLRGDERLRSALKGGTGKVEWYGRGLRPGVYPLVIVADDRAGNRSTPTRAVVRRRFVALSPRSLVVPAGVRFSVRVATDAERYAWRLGARRGTSRARTLVLRAPALAGRYTLVVRYRGHRDAVPVNVRPVP
jgi:hypothetical protein